ncbi:Rieske 2Fe-2S domain-containing protein [Marinomonas polaris]|uniref:Rieske 2Fe-2S domain-containing protein n=1 Tax=Marinomonas polaris TaxID=293552 RepID=UPI003F98F201
MSVQHMSAAELINTDVETKSLFPLNMWYVAALSSELKDKPLARTILNHQIVFFRTSDGEVSALEDRCCHRALPLSLGTIENNGIRCGYHGLLFNGDGKCIEVPGQDKVPRKALVSTYSIYEQNHLIWIWFGDENTQEPTCTPPEYPVHNNPEYLFDGDVYHYEAPYQLIHDNLLDLSHLGYVHLYTIGGNAKLHMTAETKVESDEKMVRVVRHMPDSVPPPTYTAAYPFTGKIDRWQEIFFKISHLEIWTGAVDAGSDSLDNPNRDGFHMKGFHGITPETETTCHYLWTMSTNPKHDPEETAKKVIEQTRLTFDEDKVVIEAQYKNMQNFKNRTMFDIHVDVAPNRARRIIESQLT